MLRRQDTDKRHSMMAVTLDELVPQDHLVRKIDVAIDFLFIYEFVKKGSSTKMETAHRSMSWCHPQNGRKS
jgi:transposase